MNLTINKAIIHVINKEYEKELTDAIAYGTLIDSMDEKLIRFTEQVLSSYRRKSTARGKFNEDTSLYPFSHSFKDYYSSMEFNSLVSNDDFIQLTKDLVDQLRLKIHNVSKAVVESLVFIDYNDDQNRYLLIFILNGGLSNYIDRENGNKLTEFQAFNIKDLHHGVRINVDHYLSNSDRYLNFFSSGILSEYFVSVIGCTRKTKEKEDMKELKRAIEDFCDKKPTYNADSSLKKTAQIIEDFRDSHPGEGVPLTTIAKSAFPNDDDSIDFIEKVNSDAYEVPDMLVVSKNETLRILKKISWTNAGYSITLDRSSLPDSIELTADELGVVLKQVPADQLREIKNAISG